MNPYLPFPYGLPPQSFLIDPVENGAVSSGQRRPRSPDLPDGSSQPLKKAKPGIEKILKEFGVDQLGSIMAKVSQLTINTFEAELKKRFPLSLRRYMKEQGPNRLKDLYHAMKECPGLIVEIPPPPQARESNASSSSSSSNGSSAIAPLLTNPSRVLRKTYYWVPPNHFEIVKKLGVACPERFVPLVRKTPLTALAFVNSLEEKIPEAFRNYMKDIPPDNIDDEIEKLYGAIRENPDFDPVKASQQTFLPCKNFRIPDNHLQLVRKLGVVCPGRYIPSTRSSYLNATSFTLSLTRNIPESFRKYMEDVPAEKFDEEIASLYGAIKKNPNFYPTVLRLHDPNKILCEESHQIPSNYGEIIVKLGVSSPEQYIQTQSSIYPIMEFVYSLEKNIPEAFSKYMEDVPPERVDREVEKLHDAIMTNSELVYLESVWRAMLPKLKSRIPKDLSDQERLNLLKKYCPQEYANCQIYSPSKAQGLLIALLNFHKNELDVESWDPLI